MNVIMKIEKRIQEIKALRDSMTTYGSRSKYNFTIGELEVVIDDLKNV